MKRRIIRAATEESKEQLFKDKVDQMEDDFSFILAGLEKLFRNGGQQGQAADTISTKLSESLQECISLMADEL